jgi:hypothetical protein
VAELFLHKRRVASVFSLLGEHENDLTYSAAWALAKSPSFLKRFLEATLGVAPDLDTVVIRLQQHEATLASPTSRLNQPASSS